MDILYTKDEIQLKIEELRDYIKSDEIDKLEEAIVVFSKYGVLPELRDTLINYIEKKFLNSSNYEAAFLEYQKALAIFPEDDEIFEKFVNTIEILVNKNSNIISKDEYRVIIKSYIKLLSLIGKFNKALTLISSLVSQNPNDTEILLLSAEVYETEGQIDKAVSTYLQVIDRLPKDHQVKIREQISIIDPTNKDNVLNLVELYISNGDYQAASKALRGYLRYNQNDLDIISKIAEVDMLLNNYRSALVASKKALDADPNNPKYKYVYAVVNYYNKTNLSQVENMLDEILPELVNMKLLRESQQAFKILSEISDSYHYKYFELVNSLEKEFKEKEIQIFKEEEKEEKEEKVEVEAALDSAEMKIEKELQTTDNKDYKDNKDNKEIINTDIKDFQSKTNDYIKDTKNELESFSELSLDKQNETENKVKTEEEFLEKRSTFSNLKRRSTGVYIKKDFNEPNIGEKKVLIKGAKFSEKKELDLASKKGFLLKEEQGTKEKQPFLEKRPLLKDMAKTEADSTKPILKLEKNLRNQPGLLEKQEINKEEKQLNELENTLEKLDNLSSTSTVNLQDVNIQQKITEKLIEEKIEETEIKIETTDKTNANIEVEIFENALTEIIKNLDKNDLVIFTMLKLVDNIYELSEDKLKLALWITRILNISELLKLNKIKQKLINVLKELNYYKITSYINYSSNTKNAYSYLFEVLLDNDFNNVKNNIKEYFRCLINEKLYFTFNQFYNKLIQKFSDKKEELEDIIIDLFRESSNEIDFIVYFINENPHLKSKLPKEILINLINSDDIDIKDNELIDILNYLIEHGKNDEVVKLASNIKDFESFILNFINFNNNSKEIDELYNNIKESINKVTYFINDLEMRRLLLILLAYLSSYDTKSDLLDLSLLFNEIFKKAIKEKIASEFLTVLFIVYMNVVYLPLNIIFLINEVNLKDGSLLLKKDNNLKIYLVDTLLLLKKYKENKNRDDIKTRITELEDILANQEQIDNQALILGILSYINYYLYIDTKLEEFKEEAIKILEKIEIILDDINQKLIYFFYLALRKLILDDDKVALLLEKESIGLSDLFFIN